MPFTLYAHPFSSYCQKALIALYSFRDAENHDPQGVADARTLLDTAYRRLDERMRARESRPSFARAVDEARPYRKLFPLGAPDRD